jgi:hypothetical protein
MWAVHSALTAGEVGLITGAQGGDPAVKVTGMGGIGKSLLAQEYALRFAAAYPGGVFWLRAHGHDDHDDIVADTERDGDRDNQLLAFVTELGIKTAGLASDQLRAAVAQRLDRQAERFLWIVDDVPGELDGAALERWYAPGRCGRTLLTTRSRGYASVGTQIDVGVLSPQKGFELLSAHRPPDGPGDEQAARGLVSDLGGHALALDVAGGALYAERGMRSFVAYRKVLADPSANELELAPAASSSSTNPRLTFCGWRHSSPPIRFGRGSSSRSSRASTSSHTTRRADGALDAMHAAEMRSLAERTEDGRAWQVHTLVSRTVRVLEPQSARSAALADAAVGVLSPLLRKAIARRARADSATLAHARHLAGALGDEHDVGLLHEVAVQDRMRGEHDLAHDAEERALTQFRRTVGGEDPHTLASMHNLAGTLRARGDYAGAQDLYEQVLAGLRQVRGNVHPDTLAAMHNLAGALRDQGEHERAQGLYTEVVAASQSLGKRRPCSRPRALQASTGRPPAGARR